MNTDGWLGRPYYSLDAYLKNTYGEKLYKIAIDAGFTCPNRDGTLGYGGCIFCSAGGSGDFAVPVDSRLTVAAQLSQGIALFGHKRTGQRFIAYFQAFTNTYGPVPTLRALYTDALREPAVAGISIATRPDCLSPEIAAMLNALQAQYPDKFIWIELGLQTAHDQTAKQIGRGYPLSVYDECAALLHAHRIPFITHVILGLPGEIKEHMLFTIDHLNTTGTWGIKLQLLHVLKGTGLAEIYTRGDYEPLTQEQYTALVIDCLEHLRPNTVIHRLTGDGPAALLLAPRWSLDKRGVLNTLHHTMKLRGAHQGRLYTDQRL